MVPPLRQAQGQAPEAEAGAALMVRKGMTTAKSQVFEILNTGEDGTDLALAAAVGCQPKTVKRYREEWRTLQARKPGLPPSRHHGSSEPHYDLACKILERAIRDYDLGKDCNKQTCCFGEYHRCQAQAGWFLMGPFAEYLFDNVRSVSQEKTLKTRGLGTTRS